VQPKYLNNDLNFPQGFRTPDDQWDNYCRKGQNANLGFDDYGIVANNGVIYKLDTVLDPFAVIPTNPQS
jgi:hypothetical protein